MSVMTPDEAADVLVRYYDPAHNPQVEQHLDFPAHAFWVVIDHARATAPEPRERPWSDDEERYRVTHGAPPWNDDAKGGQS